MSKPLFINLKRAFWIYLSVGCLVMIAWAQSRGISSLPSQDFISITEKITCPDKAQRDLLYDLRGDWKFSVGDQAAWADPGLNDDDWKVVNVPSQWEKQGFKNYNGFAWYRKEFTLITSRENLNLSLSMGRIDDVDAVYFNGHLVGQTGSFPPRYQTAYNKSREYYIKPEYLNTDGKNVIAVRVYDERLEGGIMDGDLGLYLVEAPLRADIDLAGQWDFLLEEQLIESGNVIEGGNWNQITVPGTWEDQGYDGYDGFAWYRKYVEIPSRFSGEPMVLLLGMIDDLDQVYVNGELIGSVGDMTKVQPRMTGEEWREKRGYYIPEGVLNYDRPNLIAVRVYDGMEKGGIYAGPIGLITQRNYINYWKSKRKRNSDSGSCLEKYYSIE